MSQASWLLLGFGAMGMVGDTVWIAARRRWRRTAARATGVITALDGTGGAYGTIYAPTFRFETPDKRVWTIELMTGTSPAAYSVGEVVPVVYDADAPMGARIDGFVGMWLGLTILMCVSGVMFLVGLIGVMFPGWW